MISWAGINSCDLGVIIEHYPKVNIPTRRIEVQEVPGRNGNVLIDTDSFSNYDQPYSVFLDAKEIGGLEAVIPKVSDWLLGHSGYQRLEDSYFPDVYRMAYLSNAMEFVSMFNEYGEGELTFNCAPEKYYKSGEIELAITKDMVLYNPSSFKAKPLIRVTGTGIYTISVNGKSVQLDCSDNNYSGELFIDVKTHETYSIDNQNGRVNRSSLITGKYEDLILEKTSTISWTGNVSSLYITPRWWTV